MNIYELRNKRAAAWAKAQDYAARADTGATLTTAETNDWQRCLDDVETIGNQLRVQGVQLGDNGPGVDTRGAGDTDPQSRAFGRWLRTGDATELRSQGIGTGPSGGYLVPQSFRTKITKTMKNFGGLRRFAEVVTSENGQPLPWPTMDDTSNVGTILPEGTAASAVDMSFGQKELGGYMYNSGIVKVSIQLTQDSGVELETKLPGWLGERIGRGQAPHFLTGTGASQPQGLLSAGTVGVTAASATAVTYDELVDLTTSVDDAYLEDEETMDGVGWLMTQLTWGKIRKLKDSQNRPLVTTDLQGERPRKMLLGWPVQIDAAMQEMTTAKKSIAFGNFKRGYVVRDIGAPEVVRFGERYMDELEIGYLAYQRTDALVQDPSAFKLLVQA